LERSNAPRGSLFIMLVPTTACLAMLVVPRTPIRQRCCVVACAPAARGSSKDSLLTAIAEYDAATARDGVPSVDFGVSGGELDKDSRAPRDLLKAGAFYGVSDSVGAAADAVIDAIDAVQADNPTAEPTAGFGTRDGAKRCALHGRWFNAFTTAADATFSADSKRGGAVVSNEVDAVSGKTTNIIEFTGRDHPAFRATRSGTKKSPLESLRVVLSTRAVSSRRVELVFKFVKPRINVRLFGRRFGLTLIVPVPGPFITSILFAFRPKKKPPPAYFDVLYLDDDLRVHKTAQGNLFVQRRLAAA